MKIAAMGALGLRIGPEALAFQDEADLNGPKGPKYIFVDRNGFPNLKKKHVFGRPDSEPPNRSKMYFLRCFCP